MRTLIPILAVACFVAAGCRAPVRRAPPRAAAPAPAIQAPAVEAASGPTFLRYFDVKDFPLHNGVLVVRGTRAQLQETDAHLSALRRLFRETGPARMVEQRPSSFTPVSHDVVQIHPVADIVAKMATVELVGPDGTRRETPQALLLAVLREKLGEDVWAASAIRFQGEQNLVVKAPSCRRARYDGSIGETTCVGPWPRHSPC